MLNPTIPDKLSRRFQGLLDKILTRISSIKEIFKNPKDCYEQRLRQCGCNEKFNYTGENNEMDQKSRKRNII